MRPASSAGRHCRPTFSARVGSSTYLFDPREVLRFFAKDKYSFALHRGREFLLEQSLEQIHAVLESYCPQQYLRVHRSQLIRLDAVCGLHQAARGLELELRDGQRAPVSRRMVPELERRLGLPG